MSQNSVYQEYVDIVDENDQVIDKATRKEAHEKKLSHRTVHVMIMNSAGELLIQQRSIKMDTNPGLWTSSVTGHVDLGGNYHDSAYRELKEELGIETELEKIGLVKSNTEEHNEHITIFLGKHDGPFKVDENEMQKTEFVKPGRIKREIRLYLRKFTPQFQLCFKKLCEVKEI